MKIEHLNPSRTPSTSHVAEEDLVQIKEELIERAISAEKAVQKGKKSQAVRSTIYQQRWFSMYVGKNNLQNEELTFKFAVGNDWWFHAKGRPGSHVIVKTGGKRLPDATFEEAARLAAHYSTGRDQEKIKSIM